MNDFFTLYHSLNPQVYSSNTPVIEVDNLSFSWKDYFSLHNISFSVPYGSGVSIGGNTGSGKTTLSQLLSGRLVPQTGSIVLCGSPLRYSFSTADLFQRADIQVVPQVPSTAFHPLKSIRKSIMESFSLFFHKLQQQREFFIDTTNKKESTQYAIELINQYIHELCSLLQIEIELLDRLPSEVSGGQLQRCSLIRSMLVFPMILILDEPVSHLDINVRLITLDMLRTIQEAAHISIILISHQREVHEYFSYHNNFSHYHLSNGKLMV